MKLPGPTTVPGAPGSGIGGVLGGYTSIAQLAQALSAYFLPASYATPPAGSGSGGRTVALTNRSSLPTQRPTDTTVLALVAGQLTWTFTTQFANPPIVTWSAQGAPPSSGTDLYIEAVAANQVIIKSTNAGDVRTLSLQALGDPN